MKITVSRRAYQPPPVELHHERDAGRWSGCLQLEGGIKLCHVTLVDFKTGDNGVRPNTPPITSELMGWNQSLKPFGIDHPQVIQRGGTVIQVDAGSRLQQAY